LITGTLAIHSELEARLAAFKQTPAALTFESGYAAALGTIPALFGQGDVIILDKLAHASLIDGARLSGAEIRVYPHNRLERLSELLDWVREKRRGAKILIITESVFSMDGDSCPLAEIVDLKDKFGAALLLDEAHAIGVLGPNGAGLAAECGLIDRVEIHLGTLSKAIGSSGGFIAEAPKTRRSTIRSCSDHCRPRRAGAFSFRRVGGTRLSGSRGTVSDCTARFRSASCDAVGGSSPPRRRQPPRSNQHVARWVGCGPISADEKGAKRLSTEKKKHI
jgi:7-keto-8-aminopelargonate synthetase-like enzyme